MGKPIIIEQSTTHLYASYKNCSIEILKDNPYEDYYIIVQNDNGYLYDGWFNDSVELTFNDAMKEALKGSELIDEPKEQP